MNETNYFDYNATTPLHPLVKEEIIKGMTVFGNPSSTHHYGQEAKSLLRMSRERVAKLFNVNEETIVFTGSGSESINLAIKGAFLSRQKSGNHIITTLVEHKAVLESFSFLKKHHGAEVSFLSVDTDGNISMDELRQLIRDDTVLISVMFVNNETGVVFPIQEIAECAKEYGILFHTDAVQGVGKLPLMEHDAIDLISFTGHKLYAPKGVGGLYIRKGLKLTPMIHGGGHERYRRAGTENMLGIVGFGKACEIGALEMNQQQTEIGELRDYFEKEVQKRCENVYINGALSNRIHTNSNLYFKGIDAESLLIQLDLRGLAVSNGSACQSGVVEPSHVLMALHHDETRALSSVRFSFGLFTTKNDVNRLLEVICESVTKQRST